jgi:hypothetical protein
MSRSAPLNCCESTWSYRLDRRRRSGRHTGSPVRQNAAAWRCTGDRRGDPSRLPGDIAGGVVRISLPFQVVDTIDGVEVTLIDRGGASWCAAPATWGSLGPRRQPSWTTTTDCARVSSRSGGTADEPRHDVTETTVPKLTVSPPTGDGDVRHTFITPMPRGDRVLSTVSVAHFAVWYLTPRTTCFARTLGKTDAASIRAFHRYDRSDLRRRRQRRHRRSREPRAHRFTVS